MATQTEFEILTPQADPPTPKGEQALTVMSMMQLALEKGQVEQLRVLQDMHFREISRVEELEFNQALNQAQSEMGRIAANAVNPETKSKYATYDKLDAVVRPIYTKHGFSLSFSEEDSPKAEHVRIICYVSRKGHTRIYRKDMPVVTTGPKGTAFMTKTHATASADSYGKRYLLKDIFNIAIGEDDDDGNGASGPRLEDLQERLDWIRDCRDNLQELEKLYEAATEACNKISDKQSIKILTLAKARRALQICEPTYKGMQDQFSAAYRVLNGLGATEEIRELETALREARKQRQRDYR